MSIDEAFGRRMDASNYLLSEVSGLRELIDLAIEKRLKVLKFHGVEIEPDYKQVDEAEKVQESLAAQEVANKFMAVSDDKLLENPYAGLDETLESINNDQSKEG